MKKTANFSSIFKGYKKYLVVGGVFTIYMLFFDNASFLVHRNMNSELDKLTRQKQFLQKEIEKDKANLKEENKIISYTLLKFWNKEENRYKRN